MAGVKLTRYRKNPVVLDTHNRWSAGSVIGRAEIRVEGKELLAVVTFAETTAAEEVWKLVKGGFIRALSVGFIPSKVQRVAEGEVSGEGADQVNGPARIVTDWELYEISVVPVPADADALRRGLLGLPEGVLEFLLGERNMAKDKSQESAPVVPAETSVSEAPQKPAERAAPKGETLAPVVPTEIEALARNIRAICPKGCEQIAERCIVEGKSLDDARKALLEEYTKRSTPVGTTEPKQPESEKKPEERGAAPTKIEDVPDDVLMRSLCGGPSI
jgi:HK97 family phage prohead protease